MSDEDRRSKRLPMFVAGVVSLPFLAALSIGIAGGIGLFTFGYAKGWSYLSNNPDTCANCHVMQGHYESWGHSSHARVAVCNDCHLSPHPIRKWIVKADNGFFHSLAFTLDNFHEPIRIKPRNRRVTQSTCLHCHADIVQQMFPAHSDEEMMWCARCHSDVGHAGRD